MTKLGIIKEGKTPPDKRVPLTPEQCVQTQKNWDVEVKVQKSDIRGIKDKEYEEKGLTLADDMSDCQVLMGVKEVPIPQLIPGKTYFFFSHTIKKQPYNRDLLKAVIDKKISLVDYECLTDSKGKRILGFGRYAGIVGCYNGFLAHGKRSGDYQLKPAHECRDKKELENELSKVKLPENYKIVLTGKGRVGGGAVEILEKLGIKKVLPEDFLYSSFNEPVYAQLGVDDYNRHKKLEEWNTREFYDHPDRFETTFPLYTTVADMYVACHYWDENAPVLFSKNDMKSDNFKLKVIADISCDIDGPIPTTIRPSTIDDPIYGFHRFNGVETDYDEEDAITVMAVDNLPCELPKDASEDFGKELVSKVFPHLFGKDEDDVIKRATIAKDGKLTEEYSYLQDYLEGKE